MKDNTGDMPLPSKSRYGQGGEGGLASANKDDPTIGKNGQGEPGKGEIKAPIHPGGTSGHGSKTNNSVSHGGK